jgi:hypothetical protein
MSSDGVTTAAAATETVARGTAKGLWWVLGRIWACLGACFGVFSRQVKKLPVPVRSAGATVTVGLATGTVTARSAAGTQRA